MLREKERKWETMRDKGFSDKCIWTRICGEWRERTEQEMAKGQS